MPDGIALGSLLDNIGTIGLLVVLFWFFATDILVSGRRLRRAEAETVRWQNVALEAMGAARAVVPAAETVGKFVEELPSPGGGGDQKV